MTLRVSNSWYISNKGLPKNKIPQLESTSSHLSISATPITPVDRKKSDPCAPSFIHYVHRKKALRSPPPWTRGNLQSFCSPWKWQSRASDPFSNPAPTPEAPHQSTESGTLVASPRDHRTMPTLHRPFPSAVTQSPENREDPNLHLPLLHMPRALPYPDRPRKSESNLVTPAQSQGCSLEEADILKAGQPTRSQLDGRQKCSRSQRESI